MSNYYNNLIEEIQNLQNEKFLKKKKCCKYLSLVFGALSFIFPLLEEISVFKHPLIVVELPILLIFRVIQCKYNKEMNNMDNEIKAKSNHFFNNEDIKMLLREIDKDSNRAFKLIQNYLFLFALPVIISILSVIFEQDVTNGINLDKEFKAVIELLVLTALIISFYFYIVSTIINNYFQRKHEKVLLQEILLNEFYKKNKHKYRRRCK